MKAAGNKHKTDAHFLRVIPEDVYRLARMMTQHKQLSRGQCALWPLVASRGHLSEMGPSFVRIGSLHDAGTHLCHTHPGLFQGEAKARQSHVHSVAFPLMPTDVRRTMRPRV
jgi:hypothetical protein